MARKKNDTILNNKTRLPACLNVISMSKADAIHIKANAVRMDAIAMTTTPKTPIPINCKWPFFIYINKKLNTVLNSRQQ